MASALMYPFYKLLQEERISVTDPSLRPVTVGSVITWFGCRILVRMNMLAVAENLLLSHQFSFGIKGGVQHVILGILFLSTTKPSLRGNRPRPLKCSHLQLTGQGRRRDGKRYHLSLPSGSFQGSLREDIYPQWHYGDGPDRPPTRVHMSIDGFR